MASRDSTCSVTPDPLDRIAGEATPSSERDEPELADIAPGDVIGRYTVGERIGAGGMGLVYAAHDPELDRSVAIKVLRRAGTASTASAQARFRREAQAMARLNHPNVVSVYEVDALGAQIFVAMELVKGPSLADWIGGEPRPWREVVPIFLEAGRGLEATHAAGIVHRDFKPANVILGDRVRVADFGVARAAALTDEPEPGTPPPLGTALTLTGQAIGTPAYMAPEQLAGHEVSPASDQYSFGVALHEALHGRRPADPGPKAPVPAWLTRIEERARATRPEDRYPSMRALLADLGRDRERARGRLVAVLVAAFAIAGTAVLAARAERASQVPLCRGSVRKLAGVWDAPRKERVRQAFTHTTTGAAATVFAGVARTLDSYTAGWVAMRDDACEATRVRGEQSEEALDLRAVCLDARLDELRAVVDVLAAPDNTLVLRAARVASSLTPLVGCADLAGLRAPVALPSDEPTRKRVQAMRDRIAQVKALTTAAKASTAMAMAENTAADARALRYRPLEAEALFQLGVTQRDADALAAARKTLEEAILAARAGRDAAVEIRSAAGLAVLAAYDARYDDGRAWISRGLAAVEATGSGNPEPLAVLLASAAAVSGLQGKIDEALDYDRRALAIREKIDPPDSVLLAEMHVNLGRELSSARNNVEAEHEIRRGLAIYEAQLGPQHPNVAWALFQLGYVLVSTGRVDDALTVTRRSVAVYEAALGPDTPDLALPLVNLGAELAEKHQFDEAIKAFRRSLAISEKQTGENHPTAALAIGNIGELLALDGKLVEARAEYERALAIYRKTLAPNHPSIASMLTHIAETYRRTHEPAKALPLLEQAMAMPAKSASHEAYLHFELAQTLWDLKQDRVRARALAAQARTGYAGLGADAQDDLAKVDAWLAGHR